MREMHGPIRQTIGNYLNSRFSVLTIVGTTALYGVFPTPSASVIPKLKQAAPMQAVGYNTNEVWSTDLGTAMDAARRAKESGATQLRVFIPFSQGGYNIAEVVDRTCNTARAAYANGLTVMYSMVGYKRKQPNDKYKPGDTGYKLGYMPTGPSEFRQYVDTVSNLMDTVADDEKGCVPQEKNLLIGYFNEPTSENFNPNQKIKGKWVSPGDTVELYAYSYARLHQYVKRPTLNANLTLVGCDLGSGISGNSIGFMNQMGAYVKEKKIKGPLMDQCAAHYYLIGNEADADERALNNIRTTKAALLRNFGPNIELIYNEVGANSEIPDEKKSQYTVQIAKTIKPLSGQAQGEFYANFIKNAACEGVKSVLTFHETDDGNDHLHTGVRYPDKTFKPSAFIVNAAFQNAVSGQIACSR